ncbi:MAG: 16S rRNA (guanine(966)-N(2))-methyltransferase RsmD [Nitrospirae bacterium]|nr:16S rRNA (guanine(966)-N(2))-methyltransferase RsmD [Nitrospirota bacterium]
MRISAGSLKGGASDLRPTSSKVREALFDILRNDIPDASFLDLYSGTGAVGFEALSRGASKAVFIENEPVRFRYVRAAIEKMEVGDRASAYKIPALDFLRNAAQSGASFNIIFADPPYASEEPGVVLALVDGSDLLADNGCLIFEHASKKDQGTMALKKLRLVKNYRYGDTMLTLYRRVI